MNLFKQSPRPPKRIERRRKLRAKGRGRFIRYGGILGWGMPCLLVQRQGGGVPNTAGVCLRGLARALTTWLDRFSVRGATGLELGCGRDTFRQTPASPPSFDDCPPIFANVRTHCH